MEGLCEADKGNHEPNDKGVRRKAGYEGSRRKTQLEEKLENVHEN